MLKRKLVIAAAVLAAIAFAGGAYAATRDGNPRQAFLNDAASRLHVTPAQLKSALTAAAHDQLQAGVKAGTLTQAQANAIEQRIKDRGGVPWLFRPPAGGLGPRTFGFPRPHIHGLASAAATYLGLPEAQLISQLRSGKSLAQVAQARGKSTSGLEQALEKAQKARLDKAVAAKIITSAQEQKMLARFRATVNQLVTAKPGFERRRELPGPNGAGPLGPGPGPGEGPGPGPGEGPGPGGPGAGPNGPAWGPQFPHPGNYVPTPGANPTA